jgi:hypothetical protein
MEQWEYEVTSGGRVRYAIDAGNRTVWLIYASPRHPQKTPTAKDQDRQSPAHRPSIFSPRSRHRAVAAVLWATETASGRSREYQAALSLAPSP